MVRVCHIIALVVFGLALGGIGGQKGYTLEEGKITPVFPANETSSDIQTPIRDRWDTVMRKDKGSDT